MDYKLCSSKIRELRIGQGYTVEQLAQKADISTKFLYEIETAKKGFSASVLFRISEALNVSSNYLLEQKNIDVPEVIIELVGRLDSREQRAVQHILIEIINLRERK